MQDSKTRLISQTLLLPTLGIFLLGGCIQISAPPKDKAAPPSPPEMLASDTDQDSEGTEGSTSQEDDSEGGSASHSGTGDSEDTSTDATSSGDSQGGGGGDSGGSFDEDACQTWVEAPPQGFRFMKETADEEMAAFCQQGSSIGVEGDVTVQWTSLTDLSSLSCLCAVSGTLDISENNELTSLTGLENLRSVGEKFILADQPKLHSLHGLENLEWVGKQFLILRTEIENLKGLDSLELGWELTLDTIFNLTSLEGLDHLTHIKTLKLLRLPNLPTLDGFSSLASVDGLSLHHCDGLPNLQVWPNLKQVKSLWIKNFQFLKNLHGLESITVTHYLSIDQNPNLETLAHLPYVTSLPGGLSIRGGAFPSLTELPSITHVGDLILTHLRFIPDLQGLESITSITGEVRIEGNKSLRDFKGFPKQPTSIPKDFRVLNNENLLFIHEALLADDVQLSSVGGNFEFIGNSQLSTQDINQLATQKLKIGGEIIIEGNAP